MAKFNSRQEKFIQNYLKGMTETDAYMAAGYKCKNAFVARNAASRLLANVGISEEIEKRKKQRRESFERKLDDIAKEALEKLPKLVNSGTRDDSVKIQAINTALKYAGLEPPKKTEHSGKIETEQKMKWVIGSDEEYDDLVRRLARDNGKGEEAGAEAGAS